MNRIRTDWQVLALVAGAAGLLVGLAGWQSAVLTRREVSLDGLTLASLAGAAIFAAVLAGSHFLIRDSVRGRSGFYGVAGAVAGLLAYAATGGTVLVELAAEQKLITLALGVPLALGAMLGVVFSSASGVEDRNDNRVVAIENALKTYPDAPPALLDTGEAEYFNGPMRVRFSLGLMFASGALLGVILAGIGLLLALSGMLMKGDLTFKTGAVEAVGVAGMTIVGSGVLMLLPTLIGHYAAQLLKATSTSSYVGYGFLANVVLGLPTGFFLIAAPFAAATLALYRRLAGLEPVALPDDVHVRDRRALVAADHPARRYHRVVADPAQPPA